MDGLDIIGIHYSLGDDCIALKSGKFYMGNKYKTPCQNIEIRHCLMENGHGAVSIGSEMAGGVKHVHATDCQLKTPTGACGSKPAGGAEGTPWWRTSASKISRWTT